MTNQEAFDRVVRWFLVDDNKPAYNPSPTEATCMYRGPDGVRCAIGCLVDDDDYDPNWEGFPVSSGLPAAWVRDQGLSEGFMLRIQDAHDNNAKKELTLFRAGMAGSLRKLASKYLMSTDVLEAAIDSKGIKVCPSA